MRYKVTVVLIGREDIHYDMEGNTDLSIKLKTNIKLEKAGVDENLVEEIIIKEVIP